MKIAVFCGSKPGSRPEYASAAEKLGRWIGKKGNTLVFGGGNIGLMGTLAAAASGAGAEVIGVVPGNVDFISGRPQPYTDRLIKTETMQERKQVMADISDAFIALPGGIGTLDEITEVITLANIGLIGKPSVFFGACGFYEPLKEMLEKMRLDGFINDWLFEKVLFTESIEETESFLGRFADG